MCQGSGGHASLSAIQRNPLARAYRPTLLELQHFIDRPLMEAVRILRCQ
jgi:hypothetical protein